MEQHQMDQALRLKTLIKALNLNQSSFAKSLGMTQPNISRMTSGEGKISMEVLNGITKTYTDVNLHWLLTGNGHMFLNAPGMQVEEDEPAYGKERLDDLEARVERLEKAAKKWMSP